jgi:four helix bundle protein
MASITCFEDLQSWQKARQLANAGYDLTEQPRFAKDFRLRNQIQGAAGSVMHNIAEGFDAGSNPEFIRFLKMARRSASETQSELYLALDRSYITSDQLNMAYNSATEAKRLVNGMIGYLRRHK